MDFSHAQKATMAVGLMVSGTLSLISDIFIVYKIYLRHGEYRKASGLTKATYQLTTYHRLLLGMCALDILHSIGTAAGTFVVPASTGVVFGRGSLATCAAQGFLVQFGFASPIYTACLNIFFMLKIRHNVNDEIMARRYEPWFHIVPLLLGFTFAIVGVILKLFNPIILPELGCWISAYPAGCEATGTCTRGFGSTNAAMNDLLLWGYGFNWLVVSFLVIVVNSILIYTAIRCQEKRIARYQMAASPVVLNPLSLVENSIPTSFDGASDPSQEELKVHDKIGNYTDVATEKNEDVDAKNHISSDTDVGSLFKRTSIAKNPSLRLKDRKQIKASRVAAVQCSLYCASSFLTAMWVLMSWIGYKAGVTSRTLFFLVFMNNVAVPSDGIFNLFIFVRLQYISIREEHTDWSRFRCLAFCLTSPAVNK